MWYDNMVLESSMEIGLCATAYLFDGLVSVMEADGPPNVDQERLLYTVVPVELMRASGFLDATGSSTGLRYHEALVQGRSRLVDELPAGQGAGLCRHFWQMAAIDGRLTPMEVATIAAYAAVVGIEEDLNNEIGLDVLQQVSRAGLDIELPPSWPPTIGDGVAIDRTVSLPTFESVHAFSCSARGTLAEDGWARIQRRIVDALMRLTDGGARDVWAFCCTAPGRSPLNMEEERLFILFASTGVASAQGLLEARRQLDAPGAALMDEGQQVLPERSFPTLCTSGGQHFQVWLPDETGPVLLGVAWDDGEAVVLGSEPQDLTEEDLLDGVAQALLA